MATPDSITLGDQVKQLRGAVDELRFLNWLGREISSSLETDQILKTIVSGSLWAIQGEEGVINLVGPAGEEERTIARSKADSETGAKLKVSPVVLGWMHIHKADLLLNDPHGDERFTGLPWDQKIESLLAVPLVTRSKLTGVLTIFNKKGGEGFTEADRRLLSIIAGESVHVLENARLLEREREMYKVEAQLQVELEDSYLDTVHTLARVVEYRHADTASHLARIGKHCELLAEGLTLPAEQVRLIRYASPMHDVGKIGVPDKILLKAGKLTEEEWEIMMTHTVMGAEILGGSKGRILQLAAEIALTHHEKWNGSGYPKGLSKRDIPIAGRILAVADVWDALRSERPYKPAYTVDVAQAVMEGKRGTHLDPQVLDVFMNRFDDVLRIDESIARTDTKSDDVEL